MAAPLAYAQPQETNNTFPAETAEAGAAGGPAIVDGHRFAGQAGEGKAEAIGRFSYIEFSAGVRIYNRHSHAVIASGTLNELSGNPSWARTHDAQIIWDATTNRFYYAMAAHTTNGKISYGFSKTPHPTTISSADWCHYSSLVTLNQKIDVQFDSTKLGDSKDFLIIGFHRRTTFQTSTTFAAVILAVAKPPTGTTCPGFESLKSQAVAALDPSGAHVWSPVPANQVDDQDVGHVVARTLSLPSSKLWFSTVSKDADGFPTFGPGRALTVPQYRVPPGATQPSDERRLGTGDARPSPAVQAVNPARGTNSFWFTQTVKHPTEARSVVRWYEVDPAPLHPVLLRSGAIGINVPGKFFFNAAISPDRHKDGATAQFGDSFVIQYNVSSNTMNPGIRAASSFQGGGLKTLNVRNGVVPDLANCSDDPNAVCGWAPSAVPDPRPTAIGRGVVWGMNNDAANTWIFALQP